MGSEQYIYLGGRMSSHVKAIGACSLDLSNDFILCLEKTFYVPSFSKNFDFCIKTCTIGLFLSFFGFWFFLN